ncbi:MAG: flagellar biosynthetic protein FliR [bacterium]|nr:MAG: flagellar biosynthetic protein FliR [bacterium]
MDIFAKYIPNFLLILLRAGVVVSLLPFLGSRNVPARFKIGFVIAIAFILTPVVEFNISQTEMPILVLREIMLGITFALTARSIFFAVDMAGQMMSSVMGLSIATIFNPELGQSTEVAQLYGVIAMLIFLAMDIHHDLVYVFVKSYEWLPAGHIDIKNLAVYMISLGGKMFIIALKISAPVIIAMIISNLLLGFISKAAPQMNIFFVGYPVYIFVGFIVMLFSISVFMPVIGMYFNIIKDEMVRVIVIAKG